MKTATCVKGADATLRYTDTAIKRPLLNLNGCNSLTKIGAFMAVDTNYRAGIKLQFKTEWGSFVATFARFEYALKMAGYLKYEKPGTSAEAGWAAFAADLGGAFLSHCKGLPEVQVLFNAPPRLLKVDKDQAVSWKKARAVNSVGDFFMVIQDVRVSLFHGDTKVHGDRDGERIDAAQVVLDEAWACAAQAKGNSKLVRFCEAFRFNA